jgi:hypothetical protein
MPPPPAPVSWDAVFAAAERVRERMRRSAGLLQAAGVPYAVAGGHAVAAWVTTAGQGGERNTPDVDILVRRADFPAARAALEAGGFVHQLVNGIETFLDGPAARPRDAVHIRFAGERVRAEDVVPAPDLDSAVPAAEGFQVIGLEPLVLMKLTAFRLKGRVHLRDLADVGLIDATWPARLPPPLGDRLQAILDDPDG